MANAHNLMQQVFPGGFRDRVRYFAIKTSLAVMSEASPSAGRLTFAKAILGGRDVQALTIGVLTNATVAAAGNDATDSEIESAVSAIFDAFAKAV